MQVRPLRAETPGDPRSNHLRRYEGLVGKTATMVAPHVELPIEDIKQLLLLKVWKAIERYDPDKARGMDEQRYVFMCMRDQVKSIVRLKRHALLSLDYLREGSENGRAPEVAKFDGQYLSQSDDFDHVGEELNLPDTLTEVETEIVVRLYRAYTQAEIARELGLGKTEMERCMKKIRHQLRDFHPEVEVPDIA